MNDYPVPPGAGGVADDPKGPNFTPDDSMSTGQAIEYVRVSTAEKYLERAERAEAQVAAAKSEALREAAEDVLAGAPGSNETYSAGQVADYLRTRARLALRAALDTPADTPTVYRCECLTDEHEKRHLHEYADTLTEPDD